MIKGKLVYNYNLNNKLHGFHIHRTSYTVDAGTNLHLSIEEMNFTCSSHTTLSIGEVVIVVLTSRIASDYPATHKLYYCQIGIVL